MKKITKLVTIGLILLSIVLTFINIVVSFKHKIVINLASTFTSLIPLFIALYNEWDLVYEYGNKIKMYISNKTVKFQTEIRLQLDQEYSLDEINEKINKAFSDSNLKIKNGMLKIQELKMYNLVLEEKNKGLIINSRVDIQKEKLDIKFIFQISARNVKEIWNLAKNINSKISNKFVFSPTFTITLDYSSSKLNPFYRLTLKPIGDKKNYNFNLEFKENDVRIKIHNNQLYASTSEDISKLDKILKEYISLSNVI